MTFRTPGGGGCGPAHERGPHAVARDVRLGLVTVEAAFTVYGVRFVTDPDGSTTQLSIDEEATAARREALAEDWVPQPFSFGPEHEAWDRVFDEDWYDRFNAALLRIPSADRTTRRTAVISTVLARLPEDFPVRRPNDPADLSAARDLAEELLDGIEAELG